MGMGCAVGPFGTRRVFSIHSGPQHTIMPGTKPAPPVDGGKSPAQIASDIEAVGEKDHGALLRSTSGSPVPKAVVLDDSGLVPRPSTSPDDPLNWSWLKKHAVLVSLIPGCLLTDWTLTWGTTVFELQAPEW